MNTRSHAYICLHTLEQTYNKSTTTLGGVIINTKTGIGEYYRSFSKAAFTKALQALIPELKADDLIPGAAGVRAQACDISGGLLDDFKIIENNVVHFFTFNSFRFFC